MEPNVIARAFEIAAECGSIPELERRLAREGYTHVKAHLAGRSIRSQLSVKLNRELRDKTPKRIME